MKTSFAILLLLAFGCRHEAIEPEQTATLEPSSIDPRVAWDGTKWVSESNIASCDMETRQAGGVTIYRTYKDGTSDSKVFDGPGWRGRAKAYMNEMPSLFPFGGLIDDDGNRLADDAP